MANGLSPVVPLQRDNIDGFYVLTKTFKENAKQNFKNLLLTNPGERVMIPDFGVGISHFLFEKNSFDTQSKITERIELQTKKYMPYISLQEIVFIESNAKENNFANILSIEITYSIPSSNVTDIVKIT